jgi:hypothetical protein
MRLIKGFPVVGFENLAEVVMKNSYLLLATCFDAGLFLGLFFDTENGTICSSETSVDFQRTTQRYIPEENTVESLLLWNPKFDLCDN